MVCSSIVLHDGGRRGSDCPRVFARYLIQLEGGPFHPFAACAPSPLRRNPECSSSQPIALNFPAVANEEQLALLKQGPDTWNEWRAKTHVEIDLTHAHLIDARLTRADLTGARLPARAWPART
jgi:hypothetical protein